MQARALRDRYVSNYVSNVVETVPPGRLVVMNEDPKGNNPHRRMTLTLSGIARARLAVVTVEGEEKREAFAAVRRGDPDVPATRVTADRLIWLVDPAAAG